MASDRIPPAATSPNSAPRSERSFEARLTALLELNDRFRDLEDPAEIAYAAAEILGRSLNVSRAGYGTIDPKAETITIERDWNAPGIESLEVQMFREREIPWDELAFPTIRKTLELFFADRRQMREGGSYGFHSHDIVRPMRS